MFFQLILYLFLEYQKYKGESLYITKFEFYFLTKKTKTTGEHKETRDFFSAVFYIKQGPTLLLSYLVTWEPNVKRTHLFKTLSFPDFWKHCVLSDGTQRRALAARYQSEKMEKALWIKILKYNLKTYSYEIATIESI